MFNLEYPENKAAMTEARVRVMKVLVGGRRIASTAPKQYSGNVTITQYMPDR